MKAFHGNQGTISPDMLECRRIMEEGQTSYPGYTPKVDVYSLGIVFFWLLAGAPLFNRKIFPDDITLVKHVLHGEF